LEEAVAVFVRHRPHLLSLAHRVLGSTVEAEDVLQEVWLRWQRTDRCTVIRPVAFLSSTTTRLAINVVQSARVRRETCTGGWLPEPLGTGSDPELGVQRVETLAAALSLVLERLKPTERAAYVLREAFEYGYPEIAELLELKQANVRKIVSRARRHLAEERRETVDTAEHGRLLTAFLSAARTGDVASLEALLTPRSRQPVRRQRHAGAGAQAGPGTRARGRSGASRAEAARSGLRGRSGVHALEQPGGLPHLDEVAVGVPQVAA
jgi:RNA polymerase sigma-70 factor (ECF subfamily)